MLGVNYWPAAQAMNWLRAYDPAITRHDFASARSAGFDTIRVFVRWEDAQPTPTTIDRGRHQPARRRRGRCSRGRRPPARHALHRPHERRQLDSPLGRGWNVGRPTFSNRQRRKALPPADRPAQLVRRRGASSTHRSGWRAATAEALAGHPGIWGWDLGNENSNCTMPPDATTAEAWLERMSTALRRSDPGKADHDRPPHGGPRERPSDRARRGGALVRRHLDARLPDLRRLGGGLDRTTNWRHSSPRSPAGWHPAPRCSSRSSAYRPRRSHGKTGSSSTRPRSPSTRDGRSTGFVRSVARARSSGVSATTPPT